MARPLCSHCLLQFAGAREDSTVVGKSSLSWGVVIGGGGELKWSGQEAGKGVRKVRGWGLKL